MLVFPIVNKRKVVNVKIALRDAKKIKTGVNYDDAIESDIIVNRKKFSESSLNESKDINAPIDFIRSKTMLHPRNFLVTTKEMADKEVYDVYEVSPPPKKVNDSLDSLYSKAITDLRKEIPGSVVNGRYVSFEDLGIGENLTEDKIAKLQKIVRDEADESRWTKLFEEAGISDLQETADFMNNFECTVLTDSEIPEASLQDSLKAFSVINTRDFRNLKKYYKMAKTNTEIYMKISYINKIIYDKPLALKPMKRENQKQLVKKYDETEKKVA